MRLPNILVLIICYLAQEALLRGSLRVEHLAENL